MSVNHNKDAALDQALNLFWTKGFASTSIKDLERATGMHPGSIYAAFGSKAKLYCLSLERYALQLNDKRAQLMASAASPLQGLADFILRAHPLSNADAPLPVCFLVKATLESGLDDGSIHDKINEMLTRNEALFEDVFEQAIAAGELSQASNPKKLARQLSADLAGLCFYALREDEPTVINEMITDLADRVRQSR
ncbi:TetR family transcriptional regulator [Rhodobacteraceae bacterium CY05]|uniref:TetR family transcriptional regulator n=1 Tax=Parasedimentitalea huanghaiensis TaxID=2682100 RepID=A0A6L6WSZ5_9RHOB|nr:TetR/AcrR family transcriptional regulator [Zongyanglinia huanghaiensis]MVO18652.1 TetR family transcriptional regulator [Zongyanglinia huanghaiensis]